MFKFRFKNLVLAWVACVVGLLALAPKSTEAAVVTGAYYAVGDSLRVVGFDGTSFVGAATILSPLIPDWTAMSYDAANSLMYYAVGDSLRVVGFDGTSFVGAATILSPLIPDWTAMSLIFAPAAVPEPDTIALVGLAFALLCAPRRRRRRSRCRCR